MKRKLKKFFAVFSVFICLVSVNLSLFTVGASANVVDWPATTVTLGAPFNIGYEVNSDVVFGDGVIPMANVYSINNETVTYWNSNNGVTDIVDITYRLPTAPQPDINFAFYPGVRVQYLQINSPIIFSNSVDLYNNFGVTFGLNRPLYGDNSLLSEVDVTYEYKFLTGSLVNDELVLDVVSVREFVTFSIDAYDVCYIPLFNFEILTDSVLASFANFQDSSGNSFCILLDAYLDFYATKVTSFFIDGYSSSSHNLDDYKDMFNDRFQAIYQAESFEEVIVEVEEVVSFDDLSWTDWLVNAVGSFLDFEIIPGLSFAGMLGLLVGMSLFIVFLKIFAGG